MAHPSSNSDEMEVGGKQVVNLNLTSNQAAHLWGILVAYIYDTSNELKKTGIFKKDGTLNERRKYFSEATQEKLDNIALSELIYKHIGAVNDLELKDD